MNENRDNDMADLESELRSLRPVRVPPEVMHRISMELGNSGSAGQPGLAWGWLAAVTSAAAALVIGLTVYLAGRSEPPKKPLLAAAGIRVEDRQKVPELKADEFQPIAVKTEMIGQRQEGAAYVSDLGPVRKVRYSFVDDVRWHNERRNMTLSARMPREEVVLVSLDTY